MTSEINIAIHTARTAGQMLRENFSKPHQVFYKGVIDIVTEVDRESQRLIFEMLKDAFPSYGLLGEESSQPIRTEGPIWIVDPLDGTTNYARDYPLFAVSIALEKNGEVVAGVVYNPLLDELFAAEKGSGATLNGAPVHVAQTQELGKALLATGFPYDVWTNPVNNYAEWERFMQRTMSVRCDGSAALDLCHVAAGRLDGYWELDVEAWDMAAGALIVQEAGGMVSLTSGEPLNLYQRNILASNGHLHESMLEMLRK